MEEGKAKMLRVDISGKDPELFSKLKGKLFIAVDKFLDSVINYETGATIKDEAKKLTALALNFAEEKLKRPSLENQLLVAQIEEKYTQIEKEKAEIRKINSESRKTEFEQSLREMTLSLKLTKALIMGTPGNENIVFTKQIDALLEAVDSIKQMQQLS